MHQVLEANGTTAVGNKTQSIGNHTVLYLNSTLFIMAINTNRVSVSYSTVHLNITYNNLVLDDVSMPPFRVQAHGNLSVATPFSVSYMGFYQTEGQELLRDAKSNHLPIRLVGQTTAKMFTVGFKSLIQVSSLLFPIKPSWLNHDFKNTESRSFIQDSFELHLESVASIIMWLMLNNTAMKALHFGVCGHIMILKHWIRSTISRFFWIVEWLITWRLWTSSTM